MEELKDWGNFYLIIGGAAGALIGLQFIFVTLLAETSRPRPAEAGAAFSTPSIVYFTEALFVSALISIPWKSFTGISVLWGLAGLFGLLYIGKVVRYIFKQKVYRPVFEDWFFHVMAPLVANLMMFVSAFLVHQEIEVSLSLIAIAQLILIFTGIHNSWDDLSYHVFEYNTGKGSS
jgi:hypothetical protein